MSAGTLFSRPSWLCLPRYLSPRPLILPQMHLEPSHPILDRRTLGNHAGEAIRDWLDRYALSLFSCPSACADELPERYRQPAQVILGLVLIFAFLVLLITVAVLWELVRKCRASLRGERPSSTSAEHWHRLEDGSSVLLHENGRPLDRLGPMASLLRHGPTPGPAPARGGGAYQPARAGATTEMRADAHAMSGLYAPYDPPASMRAFGYPPSRAEVHPASRNSIRTVESGWSGETKRGTLTSSLGTGEKVSLVLLGPWCLRLGP